MIVADANLLIHLVCGTQQTELARRIHASDSKWAVPPLWEPEVLNGLLSIYRAGLLEFEDAMTAWQNAVAVTSGHLCNCDPVSVLETAKQTGLTAYDAYYVTLARSLGVFLVSEDKQVLRACPDVGRSMRDFLTDTAQ